MELLQLNVLGNCEICKQRIENAALAVNGVLAATWDIRSGKLLVTIEVKKTNLETISLAIARAGYTTNKHEAKEIHSPKLEDCCRTKKKSPKVYVRKTYEEFY